MTAPVIRPARIDEIPMLEALVERSARGLSRDDYDAGEIDALVATVFGVDSELVRDGTYLVVEVGGVVAACGGWSRRRTLFGGDRYAGRESGLLDPRVDAARIRAFFVDPAFARRGLAAALLARCEAAAMAAGFTTLELMATLPGLPFYRRHGFGDEHPTTVAGGGRSLRFVAMGKRLASPA